MKKRRFDTTAYTNAKAEFVTGIIKAAMEWT